MAKQLIGSLELNRIYQMDCIEGMRLLPDDSVDLIVIDPPYNIGKDKRWDKWRSVDDYVAWMTDVFRECERVLKPNGSFYWFHNDFPQIRKLMDAIDAETSFVFKQFITWGKIDKSFHNYGYVQQRLSIDSMRNYYNGFTEYCLFYTFQDDYGANKERFGFQSLRNYFRELQSFIGLKISGINKTLGHRKAEHAFYWKSTQWDLPTAETYNELIDVFKIDEWSGFRNYESLREEYEKQRYPFHVAIVKDDLRANSNVWLYPPAEKHEHITPKPVELIENIIRHSSNEGAIVLDCFMGSGTTAVAAARLGRNFIGFEREPDYVRLANQRLENVWDTEAERKLTQDYEM